MLETVAELTNNIYFGLIFGSVCSGLILIYSKDKTIFKVNKNSSIVKICGVLTVVTILTFFIALMGFDVANTKQALIVSFGIMSFMANSNGDELNRLFKEQS